MPDHWYAIQSHPHKEAALVSHLQSSGYVVFFPRLRVNPVNPRARKVRPYFPGYLFVQVDIEKTGISTFQWMPHARGLVSFGGDPAVVPDSLLHAIRRRVEEINAAGGETLDGLHPGDEVVIEHGPFSGYEAIFDARLAGSERVRVLLKMLSRQQLPLELNVGSIRKQKKRNH
ncbi:MAG: transcription termination/antitermination NusG family protein [Chloroflexota bacterium]|jgi:transcriptional antiterminator RfaH